MTRHIYSVGQRVSFDGRVVTYLRRTGVFTVTKLLPPVGEELQYRIKSEGEAPHDSPHFQMAPKVSAKTGSSASLVVNRSINGSNRTSGIVGINS